MKHQLHGGYFVLCSMAGNLLLYSNASDGNTQSPELVANYFDKTIKVLNNQLVTKQQKPKMDSDVGARASYRVELG